MRRPRLRRPRRQLLSNRRFESQIRIAGFEPTRSHNGPTVLCIISALEKDRLLLLLLLLLLLPLRDTWF